MKRASRGRVRSWAGPAIVSILLVGSPIGGAAQQRGGAPKGGARPPATPPAAPAAALPQVTAVGLRVVGVGLGANGSELRAFNERPGTTVALAIQAPPGAGIVEIDSHAGKLDAFSDDKGTSLLEEGRVGPFPKIADDGSAALVELEVQARPSAGAVSVNAQGSLSMTLANGSKPQKIPNVKLEANKALKVGAATITITDSKVDGDSTRVTFGLTRTVMNTLRNVRFLDAKGAAIESRRTSSGYMNDKAELEYSLQSKDTVVAVEFDVWQNPRVVKVPFNIQTGLGMSPGGKAPAASEGGSSAKSDAPAAPAVNRPPPVIAPGDGADSIDGVMKQLQTGMASGKAAPVMAVIYPDDRGTFAQGVAMVLTFSTLAHMDDPKLAEKAQKDVDALLARQKVVPPFNREPAEIFKNTNMVSFVGEAITYLRSQLKKGDDPSGVLPVPTGKVMNVKITGDAATGQIEGHDVKFTRASGRWFIRLE